MHFPTDLASIIERIKNIDPTTYSYTRNFIDGGVSYLSPYISRGVISLPQIKSIVLEKYEEKQCWKFFQELTWREYFQRVWQAKGDEIFKDLRKSAGAVEWDLIPAAIVQAKTGIEKIDEGIEGLYNNGYMHNHWRMYTASLTCNIAGTAWQEGARWLYYHLLDHDIASNYLSWQWVAGTMTGKQYFFNQENLNKYSKHTQENTFMDRPYEQLTSMAVPEPLEQRTELSLPTELPETDSILLDPSKAVLLYTPYNLDPGWRKSEDQNRVLILPPSHFRKFPVSQKCLDFYLNLAKNIVDIKIHIGELHELPHHETLKFISKEHPAFKFPGVVDERHWLHPKLEGFYPSFSAYIKALKKSKK